MPDNAYPHGICWTECPRLTVHGPGTIISVSSKSLAWRMETIPVDAGVILAFEPWTVDDDKRITPGEDGDPEVITEDRAVRIIAFTTGDRSSEDGVSIALPTGRVIITAGDGVVVVSAI